MTQTFNVGARSRFVTITGWVFILLGLGVGGSAVLQAVAGLSWLGPQPGAGPAALQPWLMAWLAQHLPWVSLAGLLMLGLTLATAAGLLLRLEWARRSFIGVLGLAIVLNLAGLWLQQEWLLTLVQSTLRQAPLPGPVADVFGALVVAARSMAAVVSLGGCGLLAWIAWRLTGPSIRQEFA